MTKKVKEAPKKRAMGVQKKILVSACLLGESVRYDGKSKPISHQLLKLWVDEGRVISVCPEVLGGLGVTREPAEIVGDRVINRIGEDVSEAFKKGAELVLDIVKEHEISFALLKEKSPSCASKQVYDGSFEGHLIEGKGWTSALLESAGVHVFGESEIEALADHLES